MQIYRQDHIMCMYSSLYVAFNSDYLMVLKTVVTQSTQNKLCIHVLTWCLEPALRLVGSANIGYLEIILDSFTGTICDFGWSRDDASVACKQLGFQDGETRR